MTEPLERDLGSLLRDRAVATDAEVDRLLDVIESLPARRRRDPVRTLAAAVVIIVTGTVAGFGLAAILGFARPGPMAGPTLPAVTVPSPSASSVSAPPASPGTAVPSWATDLRGQLQCDGQPAAGYERGAAAPAGHEGTASPYPWLESLDAYDLPLAGYREAPLSSWEYGLSDFARYEYRPLGGAIKAVILMEGHSVQGGVGSWDVTAFAACDPSEFWVGDGRTTDDLPLVGGTPPATGDIRIGPGPGHCDWQSTTWLWIGDRLYIRDPLGTLASATPGPLETLDALPADAVDSGRSSPRWHLWTGPTDAAVFMVAPDGTVEVWPLATEMPGCA